MIIAPDKENCNLAVLTEFWDVLEKERKVKEYVREN